MSPIRALLESPLAWPLHPAATRLSDFEGIPPVRAIEAALGSVAGVRFAPSAPKPRRASRRVKLTPYDAAIAIEGTVPTRENNLHDLMNALVWASFPRSKRALHARQHRLVSSAGAPRSGEAQSRTPEADTLAMLDEGGLLVVVEDRSAAEATRVTRARDAEAAGELARAGRLRPVGFGHALYQHLVQASGTALGMAVVLAQPGAEEAPLSDIDEILARRIEDPADFLHNSSFGSIPFSPSVWEKA
ncbi:MAG: DUF3025 domain-containing protein [Polyangiaceae bacterium]|nr:DUF3025 domain-containing protein [Polyangiaceae bacterium]